MDPTRTFHLTGFASYKRKEALERIIKKSTSEPFKVKLPDQIQAIASPGALVRFERQTDAMSFLSNYKKEHDLQVAPCTQVFRLCLAKVSPWVYSLSDTVKQYAEQLGLEFYGTYIPLLRGAGHIFPILEGQILSFLNARYSTGQNDVQADGVSLQNVVWICDIPHGSIEQQLLKLLRKHCKDLENVYLRGYEAIAVFKSEEGPAKLLKMKLDWFTTSHRLTVRPCSRQIITISSAVGARWLVADYVRVCELARCADVRESREKRVITFSGEDRNLKRLEVFLKQEYIDDSEKSRSDLNSKLKDKERDRLTSEDGTGEMNSETGVDRTQKSRHSFQTWEQLHGKQTKLTNKSSKDEIIVQSSESKGTHGGVKLVDYKGLELKLPPTTQPNADSKSQGKKKSIGNHLPGTTSKRRYNNQEVSVELEDKHSVDRESEDKMGQSTSAIVSLEDSMNFWGVETLMNDIFSKNTKPEPAIQNENTDKSKTIENKHPDITALHEMQSTKENYSGAGKALAHNGHDFPDATLSKPSVEHTISLNEKLEFDTEEISMDEDIVTFMFKVKRKEMEEIKRSNSVKISRDVKPYRIKRRTDSTQFDGPSNASNDMKNLYKNIRDSVLTDKLNVGDSTVTIVSLRHILERVNEEQPCVYVKTTLNNYEIVVYGEERRHIDPAMKKLKAYIRDEEEKCKTPEERQRTNPMPQFLTSYCKETSSSIQLGPRISERLSISSRSDTSNCTGGATDESTTRSGGKKSLRRARSLDEELQLHLENRHYSFITNEGLRVVVKHGDITQQVVDVIANAANANLEHGGGVAKALVKAGGREIQRESRAWVKKNGLLDFSEVALTGAGMLKAQCILHAYGPIWNYHGPASERLLCKTVENVLQYADAIKAKSVAIPAISSGVHGMSNDTCAKAMYDALIDFSSKINKTVHLEEIVFVNMEPDTVRAFIVEFFSRNIAQAYGDLSTRPPVTSTSSLFSSLQLSDHGSHSPAGHYGVTSQGSPLHALGAGGSTLQTGAMSNMDSISQDGGIGDCTICADDNVNLKKLLCCGFLLCETCAGKLLDTNSTCPSCLKAVVPVDGNQM